MKFKLKKISSLLEGFKHEILMHLVNVLKRLSPKDKGTLANSWMIGKNKVFSTVPYSTYQEFGTRPIKRLPFKPINLWARRKGIAGKAIPIWLSIRKRGVKPKYFARYSIRALEKEIDVLFKKYIKRVLK